MAGLDLSNRVWLFDLDNTLHNASPHIFPHINRSMNAYIERYLGLSPDEATKLRQHYWIRYGATLLGLVKHHQVDPNHFLRQTHIFPALEQMLVFEKPLLHALKRLPGRKIIFSNAPHHYTQAVLAMTGLERFFDTVYTVERINFKPKPMIAGFRCLLRQERLDPRRCIMVEDTLPNLGSAKKLGMKTVWVSTSSRQPAFVDVKISSVVQLPNRCGRL